MRIITIPGIATWVTYEIEITMPARIELKSLVTLLVTTRSQPLWPDTFESIPEVKYEIPSGLTVEEDNGQQE
jgi:hypothetical protein